MLKTKLVEDTYRETYIKNFPSLLLYLMYNNKIDEFEVTPGMIEEIVNKGYAIVIRDEYDPVTFEGHMTVKLINLGE